MMLTIKTTHGTEIQVEAAPVVIPGYEWLTGLYAHNAVDHDNVVTDRWAISDGATGARLLHKELELVRIGERTLVEEIEYVRQWLTDVKMTPEMMAMARGKTGDRWTTLRRKLGRE